MVNFHTFKLGHDERYGAVPYCSLKRYRDRYYLQDEGQEFMSSKRTNGPCINRE